MSLHIDECVDDEGLAVIPVWLLRTPVSISAKLIYLWLSSVHTHRHITFRFATLLRDIPGLVTDADDSPLLIAGWLRELASTNVIRVLHCDTRQAVVWFSLYTLDGESID